jgi:protein-disulfide isomerase
MTRFRSLPTALARRAVATFAPALRARLQLILALALAAWFLLGPPAEKEAIAQQPGPQNPSAEQDAPIVRGLEDILKELRALRAEIRNLRAPTERPPAPAMPSSLPLGDGPILGSAQARVAIIELSDFQCPFCKKFHDDTLPRIKSAYVDTGKARYLFHNFPLEGMHPQARKAATAAICAWKQDAFWPAQSALFASQAQLGRNPYREIAHSIGINVSDFEACVASDETQKRLDQELALAQTSGVRGTPHFVVGRIKGNEITELAALSGAQPYEAFAAALDRLAAN